MEERRSAATFGRFVSSKSSYFRGNPQILAFVARFPAYIEEMCNAMDAAIADYGMTVRTWWMFASGAASASTFYPQIAPNERENADLFYLCFNLRLSIRRNLRINLINFRSGGSVTRHELHGRFFLQNLQRFLAFLLRILPGLHAK